MTGFMRYELEYLVLPRPFTRKARVFRKIRAVKEARGMFSVNEIKKSNKTHRTIF